ncbi:MAG: serine hydrolase domain-containing protein, partial [Myxococcota bacterium]
WTLLLACTTPDPDQEPVDSGPEPAGTESPIEETASPEPDRVEALRGAMADALPGAPDGVTGMTLWIVERDGRRLVDLTVGDPQSERRLAVASASKLVSSLVILRTVAETPLTLDTTLATGLAAELDDEGSPLTIDEPLASVTLDQLGSFVSGLPGDTFCVRRPNLTLDDCTDEIVALTPVGPSGTTFDYGSTHHQLAGRIVELAQNADWATAFARTLTAPLGLGDPGLAYVTLPQQAIGTHPLVAGGLRATMTEYAAFLTLVLDEGRLPSGEPWIAEASIDRLFDNPWAGATMLTWPMDTYGFAYHYGFGTWLECPGPVATCDVMSSPGAFGFTPWVDRARGYFGILAMESAGPGGAGFSVQLVQSMRPTIEALVEAADPG